MSTVGKELLQFDFIAMIAKIVTPFVVIATVAGRVIGATRDLFHRSSVLKMPAAVPLSIVRTPSLLDGLSERQLERIRERLSNEVAIREDNVSALETIDKRFGLKRSAKTEYQDFSALRPH